MQDTLTSTRTYGAYGETCAAAGSARTAYAGETMETGLPWYQLGDRFYVPSLRQFITPDVASPFEAGGLNRYAYCGGDPINRIDPTGESFWDYLGAAVGIIGAAIGVAATGGALLGVLGAAATGSLTASLSTTTMVTMTAATVLETVSFVAEVGSIASLAAGDRRTAGIFGWVAFSSGIANAGIGTLTKPMAKSSFRSAHRNSEPTLRVPVRSMTFGNGGVHIYDNGYLGVRREVVLHEGTDAIGTWQRERLRTDRHKPYMTPQWYRQANMDGGANYLSDTRVDLDHVRDLLAALDTEADSLPILVMSGVHGSRSGYNWSGRLRRRLPHDASINEDADSINRLRAAGRLRRPVNLVNIEGITDQHFHALLQSRAHIVHAYCYSLADPWVMDFCNFAQVHVYRV